MVRESRSDDQRSGVVLGGCLRECGVVGAAPFLGEWLRDRRVVFGRMGGRPVTWCGDTRVKIFFRAVARRAAEKPRAGARA